MLQVLGQKTRVVCHVTWRAAIRLPRPTVLGSSALPRGGWGGAYSGTN